MISSRGQEIIYQTTLIFSFSERSHWQEYKPQAPYDVKAVLYKTF